MGLLGAAEGEFSNLFTVEAQCWNSTGQKLES